MVPHPRADDPDSDEQADPWRRAGREFSRWRAGDPEGLDALIRILTPVLWHVVRAAGISPDRAEDALQATWERFVDHAESIRDPLAVSAWLTTTARRESWRIARADRRDVPASAEFLGRQRGSAPSAESQVVDGDSDRLLWQAVRSLDERCQRLLRVIAFADRPDYASLARDLAMPVGSIGPTRGRCLGKLRAALTVGGGR